MVDATKLLYLQINDLSLEAGFKSGKAASESGIIAAPPVHFAQSNKTRHKPALISKGALGRMPPTTERVNR
jgi:hypothetical protein